MRSQKTGLFDKLFILHLFSTTILFLFIIVSYSYIEKNNFNTNLIKKSVLVHDLLEISCVDPIVGTIAYDRAYQVIEAIYRKNQEIVYIEIYDPTAIIIASIGERPGAHLSVEEINLLFNQDSDAAHQTNRNQDQNELITYLKAGDLYLGVVRIEFTKKYLMKQLRGNILYFLGLFIIAIAITSLIFYLFTNKWIVQPIVNVSNIMNSYGQAEMSAIFTNIKKYNKAAAKDEIGIMSTAFERMILSIIKRTEEKEKAEESVRASHERFLTVLNSIDATIYVADMETYEILFMNKYMVESFGRDMTGEICWEVLRGESGQCPGCTNDQLIDENGNPTGVCTWQDKNPIVGKWYMNYDRAIEWTNGKLVKLQIATDITEMKKMEEELIQAYKMESIGTLAGGVAHDFNNILYMIIGNAELALEDISKLHPSHSKLESIKSASFKAAGIVKQLLSFSRKIDQELKPVGIVSTIEDSLDFLRATIPTTIEIQRQLPDKEIIILADSIQINQIFMNLCVNASHAMEKTGGVLEIKVETTVIEKGSKKDFPDLVPGQYAKITMIDTGLGINPGVIDRIFDPYFTTKEIGKGSGMGLAVVHGIVKSHGGVISVYSTPGQGTTFTILFPVFDKKPDIETDGNHEPDQDMDNGMGQDMDHGMNMMGTETILFVDDEESIIDMSVQMLERLGYKVTATTNPREALKLFQSKSNGFDLIITDMTMPQMTGIKLSEKIKEIRPDVPIIICTGHSSLIDEKTAEQLGITAYLMKPVSMSEISKTIRKIMNK